MNELKNLVRQYIASKELGINADTFCKRKYPVSKIEHGIKLYDINELKAIKFIDKRRKNA